MFFSYKNEIFFYKNYISGSPPLSSSGSSGGVGGPVILELPLDKIRRPLMRTRANDPIKVQELMDSISEIGLQTPVSTANNHKLVNFFIGFCIFSVWLPRK